VPAANTPLSAKSGVASSIFRGPPRIAGSQ
jgi:hypothetical protein